LWRNVESLPPLKAFFGLLSFTGSLGPGSPLAVKF
jgi:hypothetical protein